MNIFDDLIVKQDGKKLTNINFQLPSELKDKFVEICDYHDVSVTHALNKLIEFALVEHSFYKAKHEK